MDNHILWRCRRGTKELDLLFENYYRLKANVFANEELELFKQLLDLNDELLTSWLIEGKEPESKFSHLIKDIKTSYSLH